MRVWFWIWAAAIWGRTDAKQIHGKRGRIRGRWLECLGVGVRGVVMYFMSNDCVQGGGSKQEEGWKWLQQIK